MKFYFLVLLMGVINKDSQEDCFRVGKRMKISHPRQPSYQVEEDKNPAFEIFDLKAHKEPEGIIWKFRNQTQQTNVKVNITEQNTQKKVFLFIDKLKQHLALHKKQYSNVNSLLFSPLNIGKRVYNSSLYPILNNMWDSIIFFFFCLLLIVSPIQQIYQSNDYWKYLNIIMIILCTLDQIYKQIFQRYQEEKSNYNNKTLKCFVNSQTLLINTSSIVIFSVLIVLDDELIKIIGLILIKSIICKKIIFTFNKQLYYELSDLNLQIIQILLTCHYFTCINLRQEFKLKQEVMDFEEIVDNYIEIYVNYILQFENASSTPEGDKLLYGAFNISTIAILLYYKILFFKLIILDCLDISQAYKKTKDLKRLQRFLYKQKISSTLKSQMSLKLDQIFQRDLNSQNIEDYFEESLEKEQLFQEFKEQKLINFVNQFALFSKFSKSTKQQIAQNLTPIVLHSNDQLICNQYGDQYTIYLLYQGKVACGLTDTIQEYHQIFSGQCFGQYSFFTGQENKNLIKSLDYCLLYKLSRENFLKIISSNVKDLEIANFIKDQILFNNNYQIIDSICLYCQDKTHLISNCPKVHLIKKNIDFFDQYLYCSEQPRMLYNKRKKRNQDQFRNHFRKLYDKQINQVSGEFSSELNSESSSNLDQNFEKKEQRFHGESSNLLLNDLCNENMKQSGQKELSYPEMISPTSPQIQQQKLQSKNVFDQKIQSMLNKGNSLQLIPMLSNNPSPINKIQNPSQPTVTEFLTLVNENICMEDIYKVDLDRMQDFDIYYPEYNIIIVLFKIKSNSRRKIKYKSKITINQSVATKIGRIVDKISLEMCLKLQQRKFSQKYHTLSHLVLNMICLQCSQEYQKAKQSLINLEQVLQCKCSSKMNLYITILANVTLLFNSFVILFNQLISLNIIYYYKQRSMKTQQKSIKQIIYDLMLKETQKDNQKKLNIVVIPMRYGQQWGNRNLKKITPSSKQQSEHTLKFSPINCTKISPDNFKEKERKKYEKLISLANQKTKQISREDVQMTQSRQKSYSMNNTKVINQKLPSLPKRIQNRAAKAASLQLYNLDTLEGYNLQVEDMSLEIDEYVKLKSVSSIRAPDFY
ncbi:unnamed protein product [Paramecium octaurelia]|uniref:Cyclic nucleotide-binding domain-containing protein n=1 Tax=Paramecium octaurelia TaxID=43137 RepID=A0A8S1TTQ8_PAROT|nr:unnamed protein product [Paramecium octaurelia]